MNLENIKRRVDELVQTVGGEAGGATALRNYNSVLSVMVMFYGEGSSQLKSFIRDKDVFVDKFGANSPKFINALAVGALNNLKQEVDQGFTGSLEQTIAGEVLSDFIVLARHVLDKSNTEDSKNVAAVLAAAAFEDTLRRLAKINNIPHIEKLAYVLEELKNQKILLGSQVTIANGYLSFRNRALHAEWHLVDRASVASVLGFIEQILLTHF